jgi:linoleoyl-CoA desaturase
MASYGREKFKVSYQPTDRFMIEAKAKVEAGLKERADHRYGNWEQLFKFTFFFTLWAVGFSISLLPDVSIVSRLAAALLMALSGLLLVFNVCHDAVHGTLSSSKKLNYWLNSLCFSLFGINGYLWGYRHIHAHHPFTNIDGCDPDIQENVFLRFSTVHRYRRHFRFQHLYAPFLYLLAIPHSIFWQDFERLKENQIRPLIGVKHPRKEFVLFFIWKALYFVLYLALPIAVAKLSFGTALLLMLAQQMMASIAFVSFLAVNHFSETSEFPEPNSAGRMPTSFALHQLRTSTDWYPRSRFWCFWFGGANSHIAHHLFPTISHRHYHWIAEVVKEGAFERKYPFKEVTLRGAFVTHYKFLKRLGQPTQICEAPSAEISSVRAPEAGAS